MSSDAEHLRRVLEMANRWCKGLELNPESSAEMALDASYAESLTAVETMLDRLEQAETRKNAMLEIAQDLMSDYGYSFVGVRHKDDPKGAVETVLRLSSRHISAESFAWFKIDSWFEVSTVMVDDLDHEDNATEDSTYLIRAPTSGAGFPEDMPRDFVSVLNVAIMRGVDLILFSPDGPVFDGLPLF